MGCPALTCCKTFLWALPNPPCSSRPFISLGALAFSEWGGERLAFPIPLSSEDPLRVAKVLWGGYDVGPGLTKSLVPCRVTLQRDMVPGGDLHVLSLLSPSHHFSGERVFFSSSPVQTLRIPLKLLTGAGITCSGFSPCLRVV